MENVKVVKQGLSTGDLRELQTACEFGGIEYTPELFKDCKNLAEAKQLAHQEVTRLKTEKLAQEKAEREKKEANARLEALIQDDLKNIRKRQGYQFAKFVVDNGRFPKKSEWAKWTWNFTGTSGNQWTQQMFQFGFGIIDGLMEKGVINKLPVGYVSAAHAAVNACPEYTGEECEKKS